MNNIKIKLKKGDNVLVTTGKDKGKSGTILSIIPQKNRAIVKGINIVKKHQKPSKQSGGGIIEKELSIHQSNLMLLDNNNPVKVGFKVTDKGKKVRINKSNGKVIK